MPTQQQGEKTIAFVLYPELTVFDLVGPLQVLTALSTIAPEYRTVGVGERVEPMYTDIPGEMTAWSCALPNPGPRARRR